MSAELSENLISFIQKKIPMMGEFILKKQCSDLGIQFQNIPLEMLEPLADKMAEAAEMFLGFEGSRELKQEIINQKFN